MSLSRQIMRWPVRDQPKRAQGVKPERFALRPEVGGQGRARKFHSQKEMRGGTLPLRLEVMV